MVNSLIVLRIKRVCHSLEKDILDNSTIRGGLCSERGGLCPSWKKEGKVWFYVKFTLQKVFRHENGTKHTICWILVHFNSLINKKFYTYFILQLQFWLCVNKCFSLLRLLLIKFYDLHPSVPVIKILILHFHIEVFSTGVFVLRHSNSRRKINLYASLNKWCLTDFVQWTGINRS